MKDIKIVKYEQTNPYYDERRCNNGGGYDQPYYEFVFDGISGWFLDSSCGEFGTDKNVVWGDKSATYGTRVEGGEETDFSEIEDEEFVNAFRARFGHILVKEDLVDSDEDDYLES